MTFVNMFIEDINYFLCTEFNIKNTLIKDF